VLTDRKTPREGRGSDPHAADILESRPSSGAFLQITRQSSFCRKNHIYGIFYLAVSDLFACGDTLFEVSAV